MKEPATIPLAIAAAKASFVSKRDTIRGLRNGISFLSKGASEERNEQFRDRILGMVKDRSRSELLTLADRFMKQVLSDIRPGATTLLRHHEALGHEGVIVSAAPSEVVARLAEQLPAEHGFDTTAKVDSHGRYTGTLDGPFCHQQGKAEVIRTQAAERGWDLRESVAYAGSSAGVPMLEAVGRPCVVAPNCRIRAVAEQKGWPILEAEELAVLTAGSPLRPTQRQTSHQLLAA